ncbi:hypothetical protein EIP86_006080 [Pleurotus ostreatoroseus]|nr:hypothetical protein EIP86_006080 [Pleurotus ostreatoroseus]
MDPISSGSSLPTQPASDGTVYEVAGDSELEDVEAAFVVSPFVEAAFAISPFVPDSSRDRTLVLDPKWRTIHLEHTLNDEDRSDSTIAVRSDDADIADTCATIGGKEAIATTVVAHSLLSAPPMPPSPLPISYSPPPMSPIMPVRSPPPTYRASVRMGVANGGVIPADGSLSESRRRDNTVSSASDSARREGSEFSVIPPPYQASY